MLSPAVAVEPPLHCQPRRLARGACPRFGVDRLLPAAQGKLPRGIRRKLPPPRPLVVRRSIVDFKGRKTASPQVSCSEWASELDILTIAKHGKRCPIHAAMSATSS